MGNEISSASAGAHPQYKKYQRSRHAAADSDDDNDPAEELRNSSRPRINSMIGSLRGNVAAAAADDKSPKFVDPVLSAAAAGAQIRKAKQARYTRRRTPTRRGTKNNENDEWKSSLQRLAKTAASAASSMVHVTAPVLVDASSIVAESAKEFATDVKDEFNRPKYTREESVILFPYSPAGRSWSGRSWHSTSNSVDLSPSATPRTGGRDGMGRISIALNTKGPLPSIPSLKQPPESSIAKVARTRGGSPKKEKTIKISNFPELDRLHDKDLSIPQFENGQNATTKFEKAASSSEWRISDPDTEEEKKAPEGGLVAQDMSDSRLLPEESKPYKEARLMEEEMIFAFDSDDAAAIGEGDVEGIVLKQDDDETQKRKSHEFDNTRTRALSEEVTGDVSNLDIFRRKGQEGVEISLDTNVDRGRLENGGDGQGTQAIPQAESIDILDEFRLVVAEAAAEGVDFSIEEPSEEPIVNGSGTDKEMPLQPAVRSADTLGDSRQVVPEREEEGSEFSHDDGSEKSSLEQNDGNGKLLQLPAAKDLDIMDEFRLVVAEAAEEGIDFSADLAPGKALSEENEAKSSPELLSSLSEMMDEVATEGVDEIRFENDTDYGNDNDEDRVFLSSAGEVNNSLRGPEHHSFPLHNECLAIPAIQMALSEEEERILFTPTQIAKEKRELSALLQRLEIGEIVNEDRLYELELYERYRRQEDLNPDEMEDFEYLVGERQKSEAGRQARERKDANESQSNALEDSVRTPEAGLLTGAENQRESKQNMITEKSSGKKDSPHNLEEPFGAGKTTLGLSDEGKVSKLVVEGPNEAKDGAEQVSMDEFIPSTDTTHRFHEEALSLEIGNISNAVGTKSAGQEGWQFWALGDDMPTVNALSDADITSVLKNTEPEGVTKVRKKQKGGRLPTQPRGEEAWLYWSRFPPIGAIPKTKKNTIYTTGNDEEGMSGVSIDKKTIEHRTTLLVEPKAIGGNDKVFQNERHLKEAVPANMESEDDEHLAHVPNAESSTSAVESSESNLYADNLGWLYWARMGDNQSLSNSLDLRLSLPKEELKTNRESVVEMKRRATNDLRQEKAWLFWACLDERPHTPTTTAAHHTPALPSMEQQHGLRRNVGMPNGQVLCHQEPECETSAMELQQTKLTEHMKGQHPIQTRRMTTRSQANDRNANEGPVLAANSKVARELHTSYNPLVEKFEGEEAGDERITQELSHGIARCIVGNKVGPQSAVHSSNEVEPPQTGPGDETQRPLKGSLIGRLVEEDGVADETGGIEEADLRDANEELRSNVDMRATDIYNTQMERPGLVRTKPQSISSLRSVLEKDQGGQMSSREKSSNNGDVTKREMFTDLETPKRPVERLHTPEGARTSSEDEYIRELKGLLDSKSRGEGIDEERIYFLGLYERRLIGDDLLLEELSYLEEFEISEAAVRAVAVSPDNNDRKTSQQLKQRQADPKPDVTIEHIAPSDSDGTEEQNVTGDSTVENGTGEPTPMDRANVEIERTEGGVMGQAGRLARLAGELASDVLRKSSIDLFRPALAGRQEVTFEEEVGYLETLNSSQMVDQERPTKQKPTSSRHQQHKRKQVARLLAADPTSLYETGIPSDSLEREHEFWFPQQAASIYAAELLDGSKSVLRSVFERVAPHPTGQEQRIDEWYSMDLAAHKRRKFVSQSVFLNEKKEESQSLSPPGSLGARSIDFSTGSSGRNSLQDLPEGVGAVWDLVPTGRQIRLEDETLFFQSKSLLDSTLEHQKPLIKTKKADASEFETNSFAGSGGSIDSFSNPRSLLQPKRRRKGGRSSLKAPKQKKETKERTTPEPATVPLDDKAASVLLDAPGRETLTEKDEKDSLDVALFSFSSLEKIDFLQRLPQPALPDTSQPQANILWGQLVANWKHAEMWKEMTSRPCSLNFEALAAEAGLSEDTDSLSSFSTTRFQSQNRKIQFSNAWSTVNSCAAIKNLSGFKPQATGEIFSMLSEYICDIGASEDIENSKLLCHSIIRTGTTEKQACLDATELLNHAESHLDDLATLVKGIVEFSSQDDPTKEIKHTVGIKNYSSTVSKGARKYGGDILQVKDVLRGQITFPDENSLLCGLCQLRERCQADAGNNSRSPMFEIVRLKNLFRTSNGWDACLKKPLPTGYRHVLINVRIRGSIVAELQFQLAQFFDIMGSDGYALHHEISYFGDSKQVENEPCRGNEECIVLSNTFMSEVVKRLLCGNANSGDLSIETFKELGKTSAPSAATSSDKSMPKATSHSFLPETDSAASRTGGFDAEGQGKAPLASNGGIGSAAASAALRGSKSLDRKPVLNGGGIAAIAAAAAQNRGTQNSDDKEKVKNTAPVSGGLGIGGGLGAAAAAAAAAKGKQKSTMTPGGGGGIAAASAAAAAKVHQKATMTPAGGIAAAAAAAANGKQKSTTTPAGGIAAAAAAAAAAKGNHKSTTIPGGGGIAASAAAAVAIDPKKEGLCISSADRTNLEETLLKEAIGVGAVQAASSPRDLPSFYCLYLLTKRLDEICPGSDIVKSKEAAESMEGPVPSTKQQLLLRSLAISNQASSLGMVGWLEYGSSNPIERSPSLPLEVLQQLGYNFASDGSWHEACDVLGSLVMRCEQHLPSYHPTTLSAMLDLSAALSMINNNARAKAMIQTVSTLVGVYLSEHESMFFDSLRQRVEFENDAGKIFLLDSGIDPISMMHTFATTLRSQLSRDFLSLIGPDHRVLLVNHSLVADSFSILANCVYSGGNLKKKSTELHYWSVAYLHYQRVLRGWTKIARLSHPNAASAALSIARCLRELGRLNQALRILESLIGCLQTSSVCDDSMDEEVSMNHDSFSAFSFLPPPQKRTSNKHFSVSEFRKNQTLVLCLWTMATITADQSPDERGRVRALSLLHRASDTLRYLLLVHADVLDDSTRLVCFELYECVEQEARTLFEPLRLVHIPEERVPVTMKLKDSLTSMRRKRWQRAQQQSSKNGGTDNNSTQFLYPVQRLI